jgi:phosphoserine phosphatase
LLMSGTDLKLDQLETMTSELRSKRSELFEHVNRWRDERDRINESARKMRDEAIKNKEERDKINAQVAEMKAKLQPLYDQLDEKRKKLAGIEQEVQQGYRELPRKRRVERDLNSVEWEVMTTPTRDMLDRDRELELVERANALRRRLSTFKKPPKKTEATMEATAEAKATEMSIRKIRDEMNALREESQKHHEAMLLLHRKADEEREKANHAHTKFVEYLTEVKKVEQELDGLGAQVRGIRDGLRAEDIKVEREKMAKVNARVEALRLEAQRKMAAGEKLTFDDLQFIYGGKGEDDEE